MGRAVAECLAILITNINTDNDVKATAGD